MKIKFKNNKQYFVGISLGSAASSETGAAVLDSSLNIITLDKLFTMEDVKYFLEHFVGRQNAVFNIALPENPTMLNAKWKLLSRQYQLIQTNRLIKKDSEWIQRYSFRGTDFFYEFDSWLLFPAFCKIHSLISSSVPRTVPCTISGLPPPRPSKAWLNSLARERTSTSLLPIT